MKTCVEQTMLTPSTYIEEFVKELFEIQMMVPNLGTPAIMRTSGYGKAMLITFR
jgi:hypothetical protein